MNGLAIMLTNERRLWEPPNARRKPTNDVSFAIHHEQRLEGTLTWLNGYPRNTHVLDGSYAMSWHDFSTLDADSGGGTLRWLAVEVPSSSAPPQGIRSNGEE